jgi:type II secretory pathway component PulC
MKIKSILLAGAVAALPLAALAQQKPSEQQPSQQQVTMNESGDMKIVTVTGTVQSFEAGHSITITNDKGEQVTYTINESSNVPKTIEVGKTVTINTTTVSGAPVVKTITITTTKETKRKPY